MSLGGGGTPYNDGLVLCRGDLPQRGNFFRLEMYYLIIGLEYNEAF